GLRLQFSQKCDIGGTGELSQAGLLRPGPGDSQRSSETHTSLNHQLGPLVSHQPPCAQIMPARLLHTRTIQIDGRMNYNTLPPIATCYSICDILRVGKKIRDSLCCLYI